MSEKVCSHEGCEKKSVVMIGGRRHCPDHLPPQVQVHRSDDGSTTINRIEGNVTGIRIQCGDIDGDIEF